MPNKTIRKRSTRKFWLAGLIVLLLVIGVAVVLITRPAGPRTDVILFKVKKEPLNVSVTEKGTLESSANTDLICKVRAGSKGFATNIKSVVDDGTRVNPGDELMVLDSSALEEQRKDQEIKVANALADKIKAEKDYEIQLKNNEIDTANARTALLKAEIALDQLLGVEVDPSLIPLGAIAGVLTTVRENGSYRLELDDLKGKITDAMSNVEQNRERSAWSERMVKQAYMSPAQAEADKSRLDSSVESLRSLRAKMALKVNYDRRKQIAQFTTDRDNASLSLDKTILNADALSEQKLIDKKTKRDVYTKEFDKLLDIVQQEAECRIIAPKNIRPGSMVVYFKPEGNRFGTQSQSLIEQGAQVKEGQKMLRIPNLEAMQINTKIHEAMMSRVKGDNRVPTRIFETIQITLCTNLEPFGRAFATRQAVTDLITSSSLTNDETSEMTPIHDLEYQVREPGQKAIIRVDAVSEKRYLGHVKAISQVANQNDFMMSDVKLYPTLVNVDNEIGPDGQLLPLAGEFLKPDMTAEVTINVDAAKEPVLTVPLQAVIGGAEMGATREVFVKTANGYDRRTVTLGLYNDKMIEVREGLAEGDEVVTNPKAILGNDTKTKTRDGNEQKPGKGKDGKDGKKDGGDQKGKKGGAPSGPRA